MEQPQKLFSSLSLRFRPPKSVKLLPYLLQFTVRLNNRTFSSMTVRIGHGNQDHATSSNRGRLERFI